MKKRYIDLVPGDVIKEADEIGLVVEVDTEREFFDLIVTYMDLCGDRINVEENPMGKVKVLGNKKSAEILAEIYTAQIDKLDDLDQEIKMVKGFMGYFDAVNHVDEATDSYEWPMFLYRPR